MIEIEGSGSTVNIEVPNDTVKQIAELKRKKQVAESELYAKRQEVDRLEQANNQLTEEIAELRKLNEELDEKVNEMNEVVKFADEKRRKESEEKNKRIKELKREIEEIRN